MRSIFISRGMSCLINFIRQMKITDNTRTDFVDTLSFSSAIGKCKLGLLDSDIANICRIFENSEMRISISDFYQSCVGVVTPQRVEVIEAAYKNIDKVNIGYIDLSLIVKQYNSATSTILLTKNGQKMKTDEIIYEFLDIIDSYLYVVKGRKKDGRILRNEFIDYYQLISAQIEDDNQFESMMVALWKVTPMLSIYIQEHPEILKEEENAKKEEEEKAKQNELASKLEPIKEIIIDSGVAFKGKLCKRGVRGIFGMIRGLKAYEIENKGVVDADIFSKYLLGYHYVSTIEDAKVYANAIIKENDTIFDIISRLYGDQSDNRETFENVFAKFGKDRVNIDEIKEKVNLKAHKIQNEEKEEEEMVEYIDTIEEYFNSKKQTDREIDIGFLVAYHLLFTLLWESRNKADLD